MFRNFLSDVNGWSYVLMYVPYEMFTLPVVLKLHDSASSNFKFSCIITEEYYNFYDLTEGPCLLTILVVCTTEEKFFSLKPCK